MNPDSGTFVERWETLGLAQRLKLLRTERGFSLADVARGTGLSTSFISMVENGKSDLSIGRLMRLVQFYGVRVAELLPDTRTDDDEAVIRGGNEKLLDSDSEGLHIHLLAPDRARAMTPMRTTYDPGARTREMVSHPGEEWVHVLSGVILLEIEDEPALRLEAGDSAYFDAQRRHRYSNPWTERAEAFLVVTPPSL